MHSSTTYFFPCERLRNLGSATNVIPGLVIESFERSTCEIPSKLSVSGETSASYLEADILSAAIRRSIYRMTMAF